jgi:hypothetical protein
MTYVLSAIISLLGTGLCLLGLMTTRFGLILTGFGFVLVAVSLSGCMCTHKCNAMPKYQGYALEYRP